MHYKHVDGAEAAGSQASSAAAGFPAYATCEWPGSGVRIDVLGGFGLWVGDEPSPSPRGRSGCWRSSPCAAGLPFPGR